MKTIVPYQGIDNITFQLSFDEVKSILADRGIKYRVEKWPNKGCSPEVAWDIIRIKDEISIFFAKDRMFKIYVENGFSGQLYNGIALGAKIEEACQVDSSLKYDDWEEIYVSDEGYWLEDDVETGELISITIFIKELEDDDVFFKYEWCESK